MNTSTYHRLLFIAASIIFAILVFGYVRYSGVTPPIIPPDQIVGGITRVAIGSQTKWTTDLIPSASFSVDLGSATLPVNNIYASGSVGIGVNPLYPLHIAETYTDSSGNISLVYSNPTLNSAGASSASLRGIQGLTVLQGASNITGIGYGQLAQLQNENTATITQVFGQFTNVINAGAGTISTATSLGGAFVVNAGTITNAYTLSAVAPTYGGGAITNLYGIYVNNMSGAGTLNYGVFTNKGTNSFGDKTGILTTTPSTVLEVQGTASASYFLTGNTIQIGGFASVAYSRIGTVATTHTLAASTDLMIANLFEVDGKAFFDATASITSDFEVGAHAILDGKLIFGGVQVLTVLDNGNPLVNATATLTPTSSYVEVDCQDNPGCDITMSESGARQGQILYIVATNTNLVNFADTGGVSELSASLGLDQYDTLTLVYISDRWVELGASNN